MTRFARLGAAVCVCLAAASTHPMLAAAADAQAVTPDEALKMLQEGNQRYVLGKSMRPRADSARREETFAHGQHPYATVLACSDSRVPVEILLDEGIGDVFVIRQAGNICNVDEAGSIEYGVDHLESPLLVVLGHSDCGAVTAVATHAEVHGNIARLVAGIRPAVDKAQHDHPDLHGKDLVPCAVVANVWQSIEDLLDESPEVCARIKSGKVKVVGAIYDVKEGKICWLGEHPDQKRLLEESAAAPAAHR